MDRFVGIFEGSKPSEIEARINNFIKGKYNLISAEVIPIITMNNNFWYVATIVYEKKVEE